jgi:23S rRNA (pseudouridine1915-N3)-methyltransferase
VRLKFVFVGKTRNRALQGEIAEYHRRLRRYLPADIQELREARPGNREEPAVFRRRQAPRLAELLRKERFYRVVLTEQGRAQTTVDFAAWLEQLLASGRPGVCFYLGGAFGFDDSVCRQADYLLSLSPLTFTHELARVILLEQVYRALTIIRGETYHY